MENEKYETCICNQTATQVLKGKIVWAGKRHTRMLCVKNSVEYACGRVCVREQTKFNSFRTKGKATKSFSECYFYGLRINFIEWTQKKPNQAKTIKLHSATHSIFERKRNKMHIIRLKQHFSSDPAPSNLTFFHDKKDHEQTQQALPNLIAILLGRFAIAKPPLPIPKR